MLFGGIVKNYTSDLILRTKFKKIIGMKKKFAQIWRYQFPLWNFYSKPKRALVVLFV